MTQVLIKKILNKEEVSKSGKPYSKCSILTTGKNGQDLWLNSFGNNTTKSWREGQTVDLDLYQEEYNGKTYWKFTEPKEVNMIEILTQINAKLDRVLSYHQNDVKTPINANSGLIGCVTDKLMVDSTVPIEQLTKPSDVTLDEIPF